MKYKCIIIDDEKPARDLIESYVAKIPDLELQGSFGNIIEAKSFLTDNEVDIIFLDIQMPEITGIDFLKLEKRKAATILITAYSEYAIESYELDVVDYLLKPVEFQRFFKAVTKAFEFVNKSGESNSPTQSKNENDELKKFIFVKADKELIKLNLDEIQFIESMREYVQIYSNGKKIITLQSMSKFAEILPAEQFHRVHRSFIVNINTIDKIMGNLIFIDGNQIPLSRGQREEFIEMINKDKLF